MAGLVLHKHVNFCGSIGTPVLTPAHVSSAYTEDTVELDGPVTKSLATGG